MATCFAIRRALPTPAHAAHSTVGAELRQPTVEMAAYPAAPTVLRPRLHLLQSQLGPPVQETMDAVGWTLAEPHAMQTEHMVAVAPLMGEHFSCDL
jgi:hypothetical protein